MKHKIVIPSGAEVMTVVIPVGITVFAVPVIPTIDEFDPTAQDAWENVFRYMVETTSAAARKACAEAGQNDLWGPYAKKTTTEYSSIPKACVKFMSNHEFIFVPMAHDDWFGCVVEKTTVTVLEVVTRQLGVTTRI